MKRTICFSVLVAVITFSCNRPETTVTNIVRADGSVLRMIEMKSTQKKFSVSNVQVPYDSTWMIKDTLEISSGGDTVWIRKAEKLFTSPEAINYYYQADSSCNRNDKRYIEFRKRYRWFNTIFRFAEGIEGRLINGYPVGKFLDKEEMEYFYTPASVAEKMIQGPDSLKYKAIAGRVIDKTTEWLVRSIISEWIAEFDRMVRTRTSDSISFGNLKSEEDNLYEITRTSGLEFDSLWNNLIILKELIGEKYALKFRAEADSSLEIVRERLLSDFDNYTVRTSMPGKLVATNGFADSAGFVLWPVKSDYFFAQTYEMWAESKKKNPAEWIITVVFTGLILAGFTLKYLKKY